MGLQAGLRGMRRERDTARLWHGEGSRERTAERRVPACMQVAEARVQISGLGRPDLPSRGLAWGKLCPQPPQDVFHEML